jgi:hypothetical protein
MPNSAEYNAWYHLIIRCTDPNQPDYERYGGRGIKVCERWLNSFANFLADMGPRPSSEHSIDRADNNGNYERDNCRWATKDQQNSNRRCPPYRSVHPGAYKAGNKWQARISVKNKNIYLGIFNSPEEASSAHMAAKRKIAAEQMREFEREFE